MVAAHSRLLNNLNPEQRAAVELSSEHALILAGAGSGKTRVLTTRIAWLLQNGLVTPGGLLAVTFTNKAAKEMTTRLSAMLPVNVRGMWIGTFHGLCNRFLRLHYKAANLAAVLPFSKPTAACNEIPPGLAASCNSSMVRAPMPRGGKFTTRKKLVSSLGFSKSRR